MCLGVCLSLVIKLLWFPLSTSNLLLHWRRLSRIDLWTFFYHILNVSNALCFVVFFITSQTKYWATTHEDIDKTFSWFYTGSTTRDKMWHKHVYLNNVHVQYKTAYNTYILSQDCTISDHHVTNTLKHEQHE